MEDDPGETATDKELKEAIGRTIALARAEAGIATQRALASAIEVAFQYVSRVEAGEENLSLETLARITAVIGIPVPAFLERVAMEIRKPSPLARPHRGRPGSAPKEQKDG